MKLNDRFELRILGIGIWIADGPPVETTILPFVTVPFPTRMTIVRTADGQLWVHSPVAYTTALANAPPNIDKQMSQIPACPKLQSAQNP